MTDVLTELENASIRTFVEQAISEGYLTGRVLDWGCGRSPYQDVIQASGASYEGFDRADHPGNMGGVTCGEDLFWDANAWDSILCTQVIQYVPLVHDFVTDLYNRLFRGSHLVMTYPTNWPEVQETDLHRFTKAGMERLLTEAGFKIVVHERRETFYGIDNYKMIGELFPYEFAFGYGVVARR